MITLEEMDVTSKRILLIDNEISLKKIFGLGLKDLGVVDVVIADN